MARRRILKKNRINSILFYDSTLTQKIINQLIKKGKKTLAHRVIDQVIHEIEHKTRQDPIQVIERAIRNVAPAVEIKARRIGGAVYSIPVELDMDRGISIAIKWILSCCKNKSGSSLAISLANEIMDASNKVGLAMRKRDEVYKIAESSIRLA